MERLPFAIGPHGEIGAWAEPEAEPDPGEILASGFRYGELPAGIAANLPGWLARGGVPEGEGEVLKPDTVWRVGSWAVKVYARRGGVEGWFRHSQALRAAELARTLPVRTPRPLLALEKKRGVRTGERSLSGLTVSEFIEGRWLHRLWDDAPEARLAFPRFMANMHAKGVFHGDLNVRNMLWDGKEWVLLDLEGIRGGLRKSLPKRLIEAQWVRVIATLRGRAGARELYGAYAAETGMAPRDAERHWERIEARARRTVARWDAKRGGAPKDLPAGARWR